MSSNVSAIREALALTLHYDNVKRKEAENYLASLERQLEYPQVLLQMIGAAVSANPADFSVRQSASIIFKNLVKKYWKIDAANPLSDFEIANSDKVVIKNYIIETICIAPTSIQKQLAESITIIAKHDFPHQWAHLLPQLIQKLAINDPNTTLGVMITANSIMKRFRFVMKSDALFSDIISCITAFGVPLMEKYRLNGLLVESSSGDKASLQTLLETHRLMTRVFFSLNWQDLPEFFEDSMAIWMEEFRKFLVYKNPLLSDADEDAESGPVENLQVAILENINLYASKYEEEFSSFLGTFTQIAWQLLIEVGSQPKYDNLIATALKFLTSVSSKQINVGLFNDQVITDIVQHIVVKNMSCADIDQENFRDNPTDYIRKDLEGSDQDTRRRSAMELVRGLLKFFAGPVTLTCKSCIGALMEQSRASSSWQPKDTALHLLLAVVVKTQMSTQGIRDFNPSIDIGEILNLYLLPELCDADINARPIIKADVIKMIYVLRGSFTRDVLLNLLQQVMRYLSSKYVVIQTYAALCIEKFLCLKDLESNKTMLSKEQLSPYLHPLFTSLFHVLDNKDLPANDYVMKCIMRILIMVGADVKPIAAMIMTSFTHALDRACKNPLNPQYNHYLFECLAVLINATCDKAAFSDAEVAGCCQLFESALFAPFQAVLLQDLVEFVPYAFQIFSLLLHSYPASASLSDAYRALFQPLLSPVLWEQRNYVPALTDLFCSYIARGPTDIITPNNLTGILGVFQKLLAARATEVFAFRILDMLYCSLPAATLAQYNPTIFQLLLTRLQERSKESRSPQIYVKSFMSTVCLFAAAYDAPALIDTMAAVDPGVLHGVVTHVWTPKLADNIAACSRGDRRHIIVGGAAILSHPSVVARADTWKALLQSVVATIQVDATSGSDGSQAVSAEFDNEDNQISEADITYAKLAAVTPLYATCRRVDPSVPPHRHFAAAMKALNEQHGGAIMSSVEGFLSEDQKVTFSNCML